MYSVSERYKTEIQKAPRRVGLWGDMLLMDTAEIKRFDESNILSGGKFKLTCRISSSGLDLGGVRPAEISVMLKGFGDFADNMGGAGVVPRFRLYFNNEEYEDVPLGVFWIDADSIKRRKTEVSFRAYDNLLKFDVALPVGFSAASLNTAVFNACAAVGVGYDTAEINSLPNADINIFIDTSQIQTLRDFLMWAAQITGSFVYCDRDGKLRFKRIQGFTDENTGMIIPAREIQGVNRFSTSFSDNTVRITKLFMRRNGESISKQQIYGTANSNENRMALELNDNPLLKNKSASVVEDIMAGILSKANNGLSTALFRPFETKFNGDPALDLGDYIRMRGGVIDTTRGYVTGMITSDTWTFRGGHTIKCEAQSSIPLRQSTAARMAILATNDSENSTQVQPKSQIEKRIDRLESTINNIQPPDVPSTNYLTAINQSAVTLTSEYKTVAELSFEASTTTNALIPVIIQPDSNVQVSSRLRLGLTTISERQYVNGYTEVLPNLSATQQTLYLDCKSDTAAVLPTGKTSIGLVAENVNLWVDTTIVTCEYYFESDGTYDLYSSASAAWIDYGDGSAQGTSKSHYYTAGTYIVKFKSLYHAGGYFLFASQALRRVISGRLSQSSSPWGAFRSCTALLSINEDFFHDLSSVNLNFGSAFESCSALTSIPAKILAPIANRCKYLNNIFRYCSALTSIPASLFDGVPNTSGVDFSSAFTNCSAVTSAVPELWVTHSNATYDSYTFKGCTNAANYADIPSGWK